MPKAPMKPEELQEIRNRILEVSVEMVMEEGFQFLSMRKIGNRMGISATTIYSYYKNKDEINIAIRKRAGELLYEELLKAYESSQDLKERAWLMIEAFLQFGLSRPYYYAIMFDSSAPKHSDYVGTELEEAAHEELRSTMRSMELMNRGLNQFVQAGYDMPADLGSVGISMFSMLHGLVSLHNNHLLKELGFTSELQVIKTARFFYDFQLSRFEIDGAGSEKAGLKYG